MDAERLKRLEEAGFRQTTVQEFLGLTDEENAIVEMRVRLAAFLRQMRGSAQISQVGLARRVGSSQSRVAKAEGADPNVSLDLLVRMIIAAGGTLEDIGRAIASATPPSVAA